MNTHARIAVLMAVYQGQEYLPTQLRSLSEQTVKDWRLIVGDDGSTDESAAIIDAFGAGLANGQVGRLRAPGQGTAQNFRFLLKHVPPDASHVAFADQDDAWDAEKMARALTALPDDHPAIWCSRVVVCDTHMQPLTLSALPSVAPNFRHALMQNMVQGNTLMMNRAAFDIVAAANHEAGPVVMHDWWIYQLITGVGGQVIYDPLPSVLYRQHADNVVGANHRLGARISALRKMLTGTYRDWSATNLTALRASAHRFTPENRALLGQFAELQGTLPRRLRAMRQGGFHRQGRVSQLALWFAVVLGRN